MEKNSNASVEGIKRRGTENKTSKGSRG